MILLCPRNKEFNIFFSSVVSIFDVWISLVDVEKLVFDFDCLLLFFNELSLQTQNKAC